MLVSNRAQRTRKPSAIMVNGESLVDFSRGWQRVRASSPAAKPRGIRKPTSPTSIMEKPEGASPKGTSRPKVSYDKFTEEEDEAIMEAVRVVGDRHWKTVAIACNLGRPPKSIRERYRQHLDPNINHTPFTEEEDTCILNLYQEWGSAWAEIAKCLGGGRTDSQVKNRFNGSLRKQAGPLAQPLARFKPKPKPKPGLDVAECIDFSSALADLDPYSVQEPLTLDQLANLGPQPTAFPELPGLSIAESLDVNVEMTPMTFAVTKNSKPGLNITMVDKVRFAGGRSVKRCVMTNKPSTALHEMNKHFQTLCHRTEGAQRRANRA